MARHVARIAVAGLLAAFVAAGVVAWGFAQYVRPGPLTSETVVVIPSGDGVDSIANRLGEAGVLAAPRVFAAAARLTGVGSSLRAGEYAFAPGISSREVLGLLRSGRTVVRRLTIVEGLTVAEVVRQFLATEGLIGEVGAIPDEGSLLPETYHFSYGDSREAMVARMASAMTETVDALWARRVPGLPLADQREAVILASLVEKETAREDERARVAGVFTHRLRRKMKLQSDPTVAYALTSGNGPLERRLGGDDLATVSPYNTYTVRGLPPAPICNPGRASLRAAMNPLETDELYFVADGDGGHVFARTYAEHRRNVARWRKIREQRSDSGS
jgi:UPF0755 protein